MQFQPIVKLSASPNLGVNLCSTTVFGIWNPLFLRKSDSD